MAEFWIRNESGTVWGPLPAANLERMVGNGQVTGRLVASADGVNFGPVAQFPDLQRIVAAASGRGPPPVIAPGAARRPEAPPPPGPPPVLRPGPAPSSDSATMRRPQPAPPGPPPVLKPGPAPAAAVQPPPPVASPPRAAPPPVRPAPAAPAAARPAAPAADCVVPFTGMIAEHPPLHLYYLAASTDQAGCLTLESGPDRYDIFFKRGSPEAIRSARPDEDIGAFLVKKGLIRQGQLEDARNLLDSFGGEILNALFGLQLVNPSDVFQNLGEHARGLLFRALALDRGVFTFDPSAPLPPTAMPLGDRWAIACEAARTMPPVELKARLGERLDRPIMKSGGRVDVALLKLTPQETRAASYFDGVRSLNELCVLLPNEADTLLRAAYILSSFEVVAFGAEPVRRPPPTPAPPKPVARQPSSPPPPAAAAAPPPAAPVARQPTAPPGAPAAAKPVARQPTAPPPGAKPAAPPVARQKTTTTPPPKAATPKPQERPATPPPDLDALRKFAEGLKGKNHFEVLGVPESATAAQVKTAYFALAKGYHPDTVAPDAPPEVRKLKEDIFGVVNLAYQVLEVDASREQYLKELKSGGAEQVDVSRLLFAEEQFNKGCILVKARKFDEAVAVLTEAINMNPEEGEFYAWLGYARFIAAKDRGGVHDACMREIEKAIKMTPKCAASYYFAGQVAKLSGDNSGAIKWFKKTVEVDANHVDAQRELRLAKK